MNPAITIRHPAGANHHLAVGDRVKIATASSQHLFDGVYSVVMVAGAQITVSSDTASVTSIRKVFGVGRLLFERNTVELAFAPIGGAAIKLDDNGLSSQGPDYAHGDALIRYNRIRSLDGLPPISTTDLAIQIFGSKNLVIRDNIIESANPSPMQNQRCGKVTYFDNRTSAGALLALPDPVTAKLKSQWDATAEETFVMSCFDKT